jgi:hypothetical protein
LEKTVDSRSSISSSRRSPGPPWALATAVGLLLVFELALRLFNPRGLLATPEDRELAYRGVVPELAAYGAPDVAVVGSSRARRGVTAPLLRSLLRERRIRVRLGNFALGGAMSEEIEVAVRRLLEASPPPRLLVWPISPREFEERGARPVAQVGYLWRPSDWWSSRRRIGSRADALLPDAIRNEAARHSLFVRYRFALRDLVERPPKRRFGETLRDIFAGNRGDTPLHGDIDRRFASSRRNEHVRLDARRVASGVSASYGYANWPRNYQAEHFEGALRAVREAGVELLLVELPLHPLLEAALPPKTTEKFRAFVGEWARRHGASFVTTAELETRFEEVDFSDSSHVNYRGSEKFTTAIAPHVARRLRRR